MNSWKVILATMVIFGTGVVTGGLLVRHVEHRRSPHPAAQNRPMPVTPTGIARLDFLRKAERELGLTAEQRERVDVIIKQGQDHIRKAMEPVTPRLRDEVQKVREEMRGILTPEQRAKFDELIKRPREPRRPSGARDRKPESSSAPDFSGTNTNSAS